MTAEEPTPPRRRTRRSRRGRGRPTSQPIVVRPIDEEPVPTWVGRTRRATMETKWTEPVSDSPYDRARAYDRILVELKAHPGAWMMVAADTNRAHAYEVWAPRGCDIRRFLIPDSNPKRYQVFARWPIG